MRYFRRRKFLLLNTQREKKIFHCISLVIMMNMNCKRLVATTKNPTTSVFWAISSKDQYRTGLNYEF